MKIFFWEGRGWTKGGIVKGECKKFFKLLHYTESVLLKDLFFYFY